MIAAGNTRVDLHLTIWLMSGDTMVPLESISRTGVRTNGLSTASIGRPDVILDSPLVVGELRRELEEQRGIVNAQGMQLEQKKHESVHSFISLSFTCRIITSIFPFYCYILNTQVRSAPHKVSGYASTSGRQSLSRGDACF